MNNVVRATKHDNTINHVDLMCSINSSSQLGRHVSSLKEKDMFHLTSDAKSMPPSHTRMQDYHLTLDDSLAF